MPYNIIAALCDSSGSMQDMNPIETSQALNKNIKASREEFEKQLKANKFEKKGSLKITYSKPFKIKLIKHLNT